MRERNIVTRTFDRLFVLGRPASGKSEFLDFMKKISDAERAERFHIGKMKILDDFVWLWEHFEEDDMWEELIGKRFHSERLEHGYMNSPEIFDLTMKKFNHLISRDFLDKEDFYKDHTLLIEFARGGEKPYKNALSLLLPEIFQRAAILYIEVRGEESVRRNNARYKEKLKHSILAHKVPDEVMARYYKEDDWKMLTEKRDDGFLTLKGAKLPFVTMNNEPESVDPSVLGCRYEAALSHLWGLFSGMRT